MNQSFALMIDQANKIFENNKRVKLLIEQREKEDYQNILNNFLINKGV